MAARNERGSEQLPYEFSSTSLAHLKRGITERKWVEECSWIESRLSKHHAYRPRKRMRPDPTPAKASKAVASRYYQLRTGHALIGPYLKKIGKRPRSQAVSRAFVQELQEVEIPTGHPVGRGPQEDQKAKRAGPDIRALC